MKAAMYIIKEHNAFIHFVRHTTIVQYTLENHTKKQCLALHPKN